MNEEYLWNKTGGDAEIEGLENALKAFSYKQTAPPELPAKTFALTEKPRRSFFKLGFALAFAAVLILAPLVGWFLIPSKNPVVAGDSATVVDPPTAVPPMNVTATPKIELPTQNDIPSTIKVRHTIRPAAKRTNLVAIKPKAQDPKANLTKEEKYAYGQLMLALSITESKLKIVRDAVAGNENMKIDVEKGKNPYQK